MSVGGSALVVTGSWWSWVWCDDFAGLSLPVEQECFFLEG